MNLKEKNKQLLLKHLKKGSSYEIFLADILKQNSEDEINLDELKIEYNKRLQKQIEAKQKQELEKATKKIVKLVKTGFNKEDILEAILIDFSSLCGREDVLNVIIEKAFKDINDKLNSLSKYKKDWYRINEKGNIELFYNKLAEHIVEKYKVLMIIPTLHFYSNGVYKPMTDAEIKTLIKMELEEEFKTPFIINQIYILITEMSSQLISKIDEFDTDKNIINFKNGLYNIEENKIYKHTPEYKSLFQLNCNYNPSAVSPIWDKFIEESLKGDKDTIAVVEEILGYMCTKDIAAQKMCVLHGKSNTGKSVVLSLYKYIIGENMYTSMTLQELAKSDSKLIHQLRGKLANVCGDLPQKPLDDTGLIKQLTGEDEVTADIKFKEAITFRNYARLLFSCNTMPTSYSDKSAAFYNRLLIIPFNNVVSEEKMDKNLKLKLENEVEGIVLKFIEGIRRLRSNNYIFTKSAAIEKELADYKVKNDTILAFFKDMYNLIPESEINKNPNIKIKKYTELYQEYIRYCEHMGFRLCNKKIFKENIINNSEIVYKERITSARNVVINLELNTEELDYELASYVFQWNKPKNEQVS
ncbi:DNA primase family protein [Clostridium perfringens]|uniref:DNA primase family protein n=1 Tax=Clostridium perfringens TaxID=1502 RepID=UPI0018E48447|nr:phage/plasmid primase, P4 family [Clostridium perfringens]MBI5987332.1 hypothetical protein [Clostridium perfringens]MBI6054703.1 hypothetical protein [Clostridium perfringens]